MQQLKDGFLSYPFPPSSSSSTPSPSTDNNHVIKSTPSSFFSIISPLLLLFIVIVSIIVFLFGLLHLLSRFFIKIPTSPPSSSSTSLPSHLSNRFPQRQLQHLFGQHDSGLDQTLVDALPVFYYKDLTKMGGLKDPFDCPICLCEFSQHDKLKLLPFCSHAFHITCIDPWLLSNSTCPLCRGSLLRSASQMENSVSSFDVLREISNGFPSDGENSIGEGNDLQTRVFSVRLGKFRNFNNQEMMNTTTSSSSNLDDRRCYSLGRFQYVVGDSDLQVVLPQDLQLGKQKNGKIFGESSEIDEDTLMEEKKISRRIKGESFSVSKIWLWSKKSNRLPTCSNFHMGDEPSSSSSISLAEYLPMNHRNQLEQL